MKMAWLTGNAASSNSTESDPVVEKNRLFAISILEEAVDRKVESCVTDDNTYRTLSQCVGRVLADCESQMSHLAAQLDTSCERITFEKFSALADELFEAEKGYIVRWERIIALFAFTSVLGKRLEARTVVRDQATDATPAAGLGKLLAAYLDAKISPWIRQQGGWDKIQEEFSSSDTVDGPSADDGSNRWKSLLLLSGLGLGIGIAATFHKLSH